MPNPQAIALPKLPELLPCPFCGGSANGPEQSGGSDERSGYNFRMHIGCRNCGVVIVAESHKDKQGWCDDAGQAESEAIANWNRRAAASGQAGWQAIETAPRDGAEVLLWREDCGQFIGSYTSGDNFPLTQNEIDMMDEEVLFQKDWFTQWPDARRLEGSEVPTLWQPLPAAPGATSPSALVASPPSPAEAKVQPDMTDAELTSVLLKVYAMVATPHLVMARAAIAADRARRVVNAEPWLKSAEVQERVEGAA